ncbi:BTB/POZ domain-containing protein [Ditylenchus destructor]|uniref:BTB/POZ domain-containing protein n=1 Tax=Ditylenchus destructor TaxID=166010 RepID=A0AAD4MNU2_9BILA|nr:BTB/POZ domain-containing protein [Ditylenchus destructor]
MFTTKDVHKAQSVSKQLTKRSFLSAKLEWRIEQFNKTIPYYNVGESISSKTFILPQESVVWQLNVYPRGINNNLHRQPHMDFSLHLIGFQKPDGSLSDDKTKSVKANYKIYLLSSTNVERMILQRHSELVTDDRPGTYFKLFSHEEINKFIHPDGSLLVVGEVECITPEETISIEPAPNMLHPTLELTDHIEEMWKSKLFTDCTLQIGAKRFPAHKCILGQWSEVFRKMFSLPMEEAESGIVEISDFSPDAISAMLEYMYTGVVKNETMDKMASELLALSDKYAVIPLKEMCEDFLASRLTATNILPTATLAYRHLAAKLLKAGVFE